MPIRVGGQWGHFLEDGESDPPPLLLPYLKIWANDIRIIGGGTGIGKAISEELLTLGAREKPQILIAMNTGILMLLKMAIFWLL